MDTELAVIGGGASGFAAALAAGSNINVIILERKDRVLKKVLATGNGRCNYTNTDANGNHYYGGDSQFTVPALSAWPAGRVMDYFEKLGVLPAIEEEGKVFPMSGQAASIVDAIRFEAERLSVEVITDYDAAKIQRGQNEFQIYNEKGDCIRAKKVIIAAGGKASPALGSNGSGYELLRALGHEITPLKPVLAQIKTHKEAVRGLQGMKAQVRASVLVRGRTVACMEDELLFTESGLSGPVAFALSILTARYDQLFFSIDFMPGFSWEELYALLTARRGLLAHLPMEQFCNGLINKRIGQMLTKQSGIDKLSMPVKELTDKQIKGMVKQFKAYQIEAMGTTGFQQAQATAGGAVTDAFHAGTMESRIVPGLYAAGEILDVVGECGGYNLQWAWASGFLAGSHSARAIR